jgi:hypothetical protein
LQRCTFDEVENEIGAATAVESGSEETSEAASCSIEGVWQRLSEERGTPVNLARARPPRSSR